MKKLNAKSVKIQVELENVIQRCTVMVEGDAIDIANLPAHMRFVAGRGPGRLRTLAEVEAEHVRNVLASVEGNKTLAAKILGVDRKTLRKKLAGREKSQP